MDCIDAMNARRRLFREGKANLSEFDKDAEQAREDQEIIGSEQIYDPDEEETR